MDVNAIRDALHKHPFQPFTLRLVDGRSLRVTHRDFVNINGRRVTVTNSGDFSWCEVEPLLIVTIDFPPGGQDNPAPPSDANGPASSE